MAAMTEPTQQQNPWLTTGDAREALGVSKRVLAMLIRRGALTQKPNIYDRRVKQIARADVERVLRDGVDGMKPPMRRKGRQ
ncbi:MAG TPA: hypothetical protein VKQ36_15755 [Ktedonobacterales bacterium]|nr:hypothetical protein [Ktedonobacterales bacterium]